MVNYLNHINTLVHIQTWCKDGKNIALTARELEAIEAGIEALKTLQDMGSYMQKILNNRYKGEDNKP